MVWDGDSRLGPRPHRKKRFGASFAREIAVGLAAGASPLPDLEANDLSC